MAITTTAGMRAVLLQAEISGQLEKLLAITNTDNVYYKDGETEVKLTAKIAEIIASIASLPTSSGVTAEIETATTNLYNQIMGITAEDGTPVKEAFDTLKEVANYLDAHGDVVQGFTTDINGLKTAVETLQTGMTQVEASETNGNIKVDGAEVTVYTHPATHPASMITDTADKVMMTADEREKLSGVAAGASAVVSSSGEGDAATEAPISKLVLQIIE